VSEREQSGQARDVEKSFHVGGPIHQGDEKAAHVVEREALQLLGRNRGDQDGRLRTDGGQALAFERLAACNRQLRGFRMQECELDQAGEQKERLLVLALEVETTGMIDRGLATGDGCCPLLAFGITRESLRVERGDEGGAIAAIRFRRGRTPRRGRRRSPSLC
jgi:hypothetical protein